MIELIILSQQGFARYFKEKMNVLMWGYYILYYYYISFRYSDPTISILPLDHPTIVVPRENHLTGQHTHGKVIDDGITLNMAVEQSFIHWFLIVVGMIKLLEIVKVQKALG